MLSIFKNILLLLIFTSSVFVNAQDLEKEATSKIKTLEKLIKKAKKKNPKA